MGGSSRAGLAVQTRLAPPSPNSRTRPANATGPATLAVEVVSTGRLRAPGLARWLQATAPKKARGAVAVALVPDARIRQLNARYRGKNSATDVLSFAAEEPGFLGEVVIASGVARRQARQAGHPIQVELRVLALHGLLHLLGYDHERDGGRMARVERRLRRKGGLREGLIERGRQ
jgi:probable rRNA maturation factor